MLRTLSSTFRVGIAIMFAVLSSGLMPVYASAAKPPNPDAPVDSITFCHATPVDTAANGWEKLTTAPQVVYTAGHDTEHDADIIPPFSYTQPGDDEQTLVFEGLNWDEEGQAIYANDCVYVEDEEPEEPGADFYCDPTNRPAGVSIEDWIPADLKCVDFEVTNTCGNLTATITKHESLTYEYDVAWSEDKENIGYENVLPKTFEEDYNGGSVDVYFWLVGEEEGYVAGEARDIYNYWDGTFDAETVITNCVEDEEPEEPGADFYCDPTNRPAGVSIEDWIPADLKCVDFEVTNTCGNLTATITKHESLTYEYDVAWSEDKENIGYENVLPKTFEEDYNGGSVDVYFWLVGEEEGYVAGEARDIYNYWDGTFDAETVITNCVEDEEPETPVVTTPTTPSTPTNPGNTQGDDDESFETPQVLGVQTPEVLPATGNTESSLHLIGAVLAALTYAVMYRRDTADQV